MSSLTGSRNEPTSVASRRLHSAFPRSGGRNGRTGRLRLPYNSIFLPEYVSTVILSVLISWFFLTNVNRIGRGWGQMFHLSAASAGYVLLAAFLIWITWRYRVWFSDVLFLSGGDGRTRVRVSRRWMDLEHLESLEEIVGSFFGRAARILTARNSSGELFEVNECLSGYDELKMILRELRGIEVTSAERRTAEEMQALQMRWRRRHQVFPPAFTLIDAAGRLSFRVFCLLPVAAVDVTINAVLNILLQNAGRGALVVYVAPLSLFVSAFIARYVYYYLFTSTRLNRRIG